jgi:hypothetical protein
MGETSTACFLTAPPDPILVESSLAPPLITASTKTLKIKEFQKKTYLDGVLSSHKMNNFKGLLNDSDGENLLTRVSTVVHKAID